jgi:hypothetical protein
MHTSGKAEFTLALNRPSAADLLAVARRQIVQITEIGAPSGRVRRIDRTGGQTRRIVSSSAA